MLRNTVVRSRERAAHRFNLGLLPSMALCQICYLLGPEDESNVSFQNSGVSYWGSVLWTFVCCGSVISTSSPILTPKQHPQPETGLERETTYLSVSSLTTATAFLTVYPAQTLTSSCHQGLSGMVPSEPGHCFQGNLYFNDSLKKQTLEPSLLSLNPSSITC